ncbi:hypothetical protein [Streptomyces sp. SPB074]|uniref:hypothetical protein n=1 Tax=Streptomyces sp. (strain SPB074) TaxID=465543 RepID=UPI00017F1D81|nr:hypothetical protein [Streptomyces sp. SPB074]
MNRVPPLTGPRLHARAHHVPGVLLFLLANALLCAVVSRTVEAYRDPGRLTPLVALGPLLAASALGGATLSPLPEIAPTTSRPGPWPRLVLYLALALTGAALLALAVPGGGTGAHGYGPGGMARNVLGVSGLAAVSAVVLGARLSWLPVLGWGTAVFLGGAAPRPYAAVARLWAWIDQPAGDGPALAVALLSFLAGGALYAAKGARPVRG